MVLVSLVLGPVAVAELDFLEGDWEKLVLPCIKTFDGTCGRARTN